MTLMMEYKERYNEGFSNGIEDGIKQGIEQGIEVGIEQGIEVFVLDKLEENIPKEKVVEKLQKGFKLSEEKARYYYDKIAYNKD